MIKVERNISRSINSGFTYGVIDPLSIFSFMFSIAILFHFLSGPGDTGETFFPATPELTSTIDISTLAGFLTLCFALLLAIKPRSFTLLCFLSTSLIVHYIIVSPNGLNHYIMNAVLCVTICISALFFLNKKESVNHRSQFYNTFASSGRFLLVTMYFFGIFHKINPDFLNPDLSCAVILTREMTSQFNLDEIQWIKYSAIWATFIMEGVAMLALFSRRWKYWGFVIGIPFHLVVAFSGYRFFMEYSSAVIALYFLFLPREFYCRINSFTEKISKYLSLSIDQFWKRIQIVFCVIGLLGGIYTAYVLMSGGKTNPSEYVHRMMPIFALYSLIVYFVILYFSRNIDHKIKEPMYLFPKPMIAIFPILFFLNGFGPYLGWKTESSISMFSHLHTEGSRTNHLMFNKLPQIFDYQKKLVKIISSPHPKMQHFAENGNLLVYFELRRFVTLNPGIPVTYEIDGVSYQHDENNTDNIKPVPWWLHKMLLFKPVDNNWPKVCTH